MLAGNDPPGSFVCARHLSPLRRRRRGHPGRPRPRGRRPDLAGHPRRPALSAVVTVPKSPPPPRGAPVEPTRKNASVCGATSPQQDRPILAARPPATTNWSCSRSRSGTDRASEPAALRWELGATWRPVLGPASLRRAVDHRGSRSVRSCPSRATFTCLFEEVEVFVPGPHGVDDELVAAVEGHDRQLKESAGLDLHAT